MLIYSDIYFNIDNVVSSGPSFFFIKPNSRSRLGLNVKNERCAGASERAFMIYFSTTSPAKETCIFTKNKLPPPPPEVPFDGCGHAPTAAAVKCFMWLQKVCDWLPSSVRDLQVDSWCSGLWGGNSTFVIRVIFFFFYDLLWFLFLSSESLRFNYLLPFLCAAQGKALIYGAGWVEFYSSWNHPRFVLIKNSFNGRHWLCFKSLLLFAKT